MSLSNQDINRLKSYFLSKDGGILQGEVTPGTDLTYDLGRSDKRWDTIYVGTIIADSIQSGGGFGDADTVDGFDAAQNPIASTLLALDPQGVFPIGVYNEALLKDGSRALEGSLIVVAGATIDGVDIGTHVHTGVGDQGVQLSHATLTGLDADDHLQYAERAQDETITGDWMFTHLVDRSAGWVFLPDDKVFKAIPHNLVLKADENEASIGIGPIVSTEYAIFLFDDTTPTTYIKVGRGADSVTLSGTDTTYRLWAGHADGSSAPFSVEKDGSLFAAAGEIAGWVIDTDSISKNDMVLHSSGYIAAGTGDDLVRIDSQDATWRLWAGNAVAANAPFRVNKIGDLYIGSGYVSGVLRSTNFISGQTGFALNSSGLAEFDNIIARGRLQATVFAEATISVASGKLIISDGAVIATDIDSADDFIIVDSAVFLQNDIVRLKPDVNRDEWMRITSPFITVGDAYKYFVVRSLNSSEGGWAGPYDFYAGESVVRMGSAEELNIIQPLASGEVGGEYGEIQPGGSGSTTGGGFLILEGSRQFGPYFGVAARFGPVYDQLLDVVRIGNLDGVLDYTSEEWGAFFGDANAFMTYDQTQGLRIEFSGSGVDTTIDDTGISTETISIAKVTAPGDSSSPYGFLYHDTSDNRLYWKYIGTTYDLTGGGGASNDESYVVMALSGSLTDERRLQGTVNQVILSDGGAGGDATLSLPSDINLTGASSIGTTSSTLTLDPVGNLILNPAALITLSKGLSANWDAGSFEIRSATFESDIVTGTAPFIVDSTTKVSNLNVDLLDDQSGAHYLDSANFTGTNWTDLTDGGETTLHTHASGAPDAHDIEGAFHTASGLTVGHVLRASGATAFSFAALQAGDIPQLDHGGLAGLGDHDHSIYSRIAIDEAISGRWSFSKKVGVSSTIATDVLHFGLSSNVTRSSGATAATVALFGHTHGESGVTAPLWGVVTEAWAHPGANAQLVGGELAVVNEEDANTKAKVGMDLAFKDRADGQTATQTGVGSNQYNEFSRAIQITSQPRSTDGEYSGWQSIMHFEANAIDRTVSKDYSVIIDLRLVSVDQASNNPWLVLWDDSGTEYGLRFNTTSNAIEFVEDWDGTPVVHDLTEGSGSPFSLGIIVNDGGTDSDSRFEGANFDDVWFLNAGMDVVVIGGQSTKKDEYKLSLQSFADGGWTDTNDMVGIMLGDVEGSGEAANHTFLDYVSGGWQAYFNIHALNLEFNPDTGLWIQELATHYSLYYSQVSRTVAVNENDSGHNFYYSDPGDAVLHSIMHLGPTGVIINADGIAAHDVRVESEDEEYFLVIDAGLNKMVIGQQAPHTDMLLTMIDDDWNSENHVDLLAFTQWAMGPIAGAERSSTTNFHSLSMAATKQSQWALNRYITRSDIAWNRYDTAFWASSLMQQNTAGASNLVFFAYDGTTEYNIVDFGSGGIVFNEGSMDFDIRFETDDLTHALFLDGVDNLILFGTDTPYDDGTQKSFVTVFWDHAHADGYKYLLTLEGEGGSSILNMTAYHTSSSGAGYVGRSARGTRATPTPSQSGDRLGFNLYGSYDGADWGQYTGMEMYAAENIGVSNKGSYTQIVATDIGSTSRVAVAKFYVANVIIEPTLQLKQITAPGAGPSGYGNLFYKTGNDGLFWHPNGGSEVDLTEGTGGGGVSVLEVQVFS